MRKLLTAAMLLVCVFAISAAAAEMSGILTCEKCRHTDEKAMDCAKTCVKNGVPVGFVNAADGKYFKIANQDKVKAHVGHKVAVTGKVDGETLTVDTLKMAEGKAKGKG